MKLLILSQYFWPEGFRINEVAKTLLEKGVEVEVLTGKPNYPQGQIYTGYRASGCHQENYHGINLIRLPLISRGVGAVRLVLNYCSFVLSGLIFSPWLLRNKKFDVIFIYGTSPILQAIPAFFIAWLKGCSVVLWVQDLWPESLSATGYVRNRAVLKLVEWIVSYIYRHSDLILISSKGFEGPVKALAKGKTVLYYPNSVDGSFAVPAQIDLPIVAGFDGGFSVLFAGNVGVAQAVDVIVEAADLLKRYTDISFIVLGDGSSRAGMIEEVQRRGLDNVHLPGRFPVETMPGFMQKASVLLVTLTDKPIFALTVPNKVQAYMASGRPIIACLNGEGARLVVEAGVGLATPAEDAQGLAETILRLYRLPANERESMGMNGRKYYKDHFDHEPLIDELIQHLKTVIKPQ
jgi:glycosyltransferase involved in cell wall biosynthesis